MRDRKAFTLIELLVVVAVIAILISILLPALGKARCAARAIQAANIQRQMAIGAASYGVENKQFFPGVNTSGLTALGHIIAGNLDRFDENPGLPVQTLDWMSPALGDELPDERNARFATLMSVFADPAQKWPVTFLGSGNGNVQPDQGAADLAMYLENEWYGEPLSAVSFLQPANFQLYGGDSIVDIQGGGPFGGGTVLGVRRLGQDNASGIDGHEYGSTTGTAVIPEGYAPRYDKLRNQSEKIYSATGTRFVTDSGIPSTNGGWQVDIYGDFCSSGPTFRGSNAYGDMHASSMGLNLPISYRHCNMRMVAAFWDGSSQQLSMTESRDPKYTWPTASRFTASEWEEVQAGYEPGDRIP
ncbi:unnamed protein product [Symbiodinium necroappetens]|uniref:Prepilin-type N-terminal cleavage/methylation domain-containing protein n=1 Tax=Symbiodinium necroappetens TaxID=1628268 RepID=A0A813AFQ9_9DINO|nr:unnamed protein product [Symbiodinium necroappetens]